MNSLQVMMYLRFRILITLFLLINCVTISADEFDTNSLKTSQAQPLAPFVGTSKTPQKSAPSVVMLPPRVLISSNAKNIEVATAAVDRLAGELSADGTIQVVNRTELKRLLDERKIAKGKQKPITSYSTMIRLKVVLKNKQPRTILTVLDLSTGNVLGEQEFGWSLQESDVPSMKKVCVDAIKKSNQQHGKKVRIRFVGVTDTGGSNRLNSLANRTSVMFRESLANSSEILMLQHLEAQTSREESLLLLMGLSKLPGSQRFIPQANATIELRLLEKKSIGKTFAETIISVGIRLKENDDVKNDWSETTGKVKEIDKLIQQSWNQLALKLKGIHPKTFTKTLDDFRTRHKQAEAELRSAVAGIEFSHKKEVSSDKQLSQINQSIKHCETALKLDPTYAEAQYQLTKSLCEKFQYFYPFTPGKNVYDPFETKHEQLYRRIIIESAKYLEHPGKQNHLSVKVAFQVAWYYIRRERVTSKRALWQNQHKISSSEKEILNRLKTILLRGADGGADTFQVNSYVELMRVIHQGMTLSNTSLKDQKKFFLQVIAAVDRLYPKSDSPLKLNNRKLIYFQKRSAQSRFFIRLKVASIFIKAGDLSFARQLIADARDNEMPDKSLLKIMGSDSRFFINGLRKATVKLKDPVARKEFDLWKKKILAIPLPQKVALIRVEYRKTLSLLSESKPEKNDKKTSLKSIGLSNYHLVKHKYAGLTSPHHTEVLPLAVANNRLYVLVQKEYHQEHFLAYVPLNQSGAPIGNQKKVFEKFKRSYYQWDNFHFLPHEENNREMTGQITQAFVDHAGKLVLAMSNTKTKPAQAGISIYSPDTKKWSHIREKEGIPVEAFYSFFQLDKNRLYCAGAGLDKSVKHGSLLSHFIVHLDTKSVKLLHQSKTRNSWKSGKVRGEVLRPMWWVDGKLNGPASTDLLAEKPRSRKYPLWGISDYHVINSRRFVSSSKNGLFEYNQHEKIVKHWRTYHAHQQTLFQYVLHFPSSGNSPEHAAMMAKAGNYLVFPSMNNIGLILFDPLEDKWYGPVGDFYVPRDNRHMFTARKPFIGSEHGIWSVSKSRQGYKMAGIRYVKTADIIAEAKATGRVQTTKEYQQSINKKIETLPLKYRAIANAMGHHYSAAKIDLEQWLKVEPNNEQALFLLGVIHDQIGLKKVDIASNYYQQLIDLPNPSAKLTGMLCLLEIHRRAKRWQKVIDLGNQIIDLSPLLPLNVKPQVAYRMKVAKQNLKPLADKNKE